MKTTPVYSSFFQCLYDEDEPVGNLGRGTHYSVLRCAEWRDVTRKSLAVPQVHDFAIIWDEDHDIRVIEAVEAIYMADLLSPVQFIGERKGMLTVILAARFDSYGEGAEAYAAKVTEVVGKLPNGDVWPVEVGLFDRSEIRHQIDLKGLVSDHYHRVETYVRNIDSLWGLGTKPWSPHAHSLATQQINSRSPLQGPSLPSVPGWVSPAPSASA